MSWNRTSEAGFLSMALALSACGQQAGDDYQGEPLLSLRGQVIVSALTGGRDVEPALCFFNADLPDPPQLDLSKLPAEPRAELEISGGDIVQALNKGATHILDVESRGEFPARFDVDVYLPPAAEALSLAYLEGEPRWASGFVCAVATEHPSVTFPIASGGIIEPTKARFALVSQATSRFYYEAYDCTDESSWPSAANPSCEKHTEGDPGLIYEFGGHEFTSEWVLGAAHDFDVVYLEDDAPAGTYTAWLYGAADGLSAGYHLLAPIELPSDGPSASALCWADISGDASAEINAQLGERVKQALGAQYTINFPQARNSDGSSVVDLPADVYRDAMSIIGHMEMERCPFQPRHELDAALHTLSIDIANGANTDLSTFFGTGSLGG